MSSKIDFVSFTTVRFRNMQFHELLPRVLVAVSEEYGTKGATVQPIIFLHKDLPDTVIIKNFIVPQDTIPQTHSRLYVDPLCAAAVLRGADIFASGVVGMEPAAADNSAAAVSVSVFACLGKFNAGFKRIYTGESVFIGNGRLVIPGQQLLGNIHAHSGVAVSMTQPLCVCPSFQSDLFLSGSLVAQNLPSLVCARVLGPQPGEIVLDMCAAPGGKCMHLADLMEQRGTLIAIDKSAKRLQSVRESAVKLGIDTQGFLAIHYHDSCRLCDPDGSDVSDPASRRPPFQPGQFDRILLDAPCSALGQRPRLTAGAADSGEEGKKAASLNSYAPLQRRLLRTASELLKPGGCLVYSTCTTRPEENESQVAWVLENLPRLRLAEQRPNLRPLCLAPGGSSSPSVQKFQPLLPSSSTEACPSAEEACNWDTIGFFIAKFVAVD